MSNLEINSIKNLSVKLSDKMQLLKQIIMNPTENKIIEFKYSLKRSRIKDFNNLLVKQTNSKIDISPKNLISKSDSLKYSLQNLIKITPTNKHYPQSQFSYFEKLPNPNRQRTTLFSSQYNKTKPKFKTMFLNHKEYNRDSSLNNSFYSDKFKKQKTSAFLGIEKSNNFLENISFVGVKKINASTNYYNQNLKNNFFFKADSSDLDSKVKYLKNNIKINKEAFLKLNNKLKF